MPHTPLSPEQDEKHKINIVNREDLQWETKAITEALGIIYHTTRDIENLEVNFNDRNTIQEVENYRLTILNCLRVVLEKNVKVSRAQQILGQTPHPRLTKAYEQKAQEITILSEARIQQLRVIAGKKTIDDACTAIKHCSFSFENIEVIPEVFTQRDAYYVQLEAIKQNPSLIEAFSVQSEEEGQSLKSQFDAVCKTKETELKSAVDAALVRSRLHSRLMIGLLTDSQFIHCMERFEIRCCELEEKANHSPEYRNVAWTAREVCAALNTNKENLLNGQISLTSFKKECLERIHSNSLEILGSQQGLSWKQFFCDLCNAILIIGCVINYAVTGQFRLFKPDTDSTQKAQEALQAVEQNLVTFNA